MDIIRTKQKNWIGHILRGNSPQKETMEGRIERKIGRQKLMDRMMGIRETQGKGTTSRSVESLDIWTCREADYLKKKRTVQFSGSVAICTPFSHFPS